mmetsp:Transcript_18089/g.19610  ORF Transcript_18089/g.19610 Transcript_18089/m.19610 type:complete len:91 (+) Transcript_18089:236-508(+)
MDNVKLNFDLPQEDELASNIMSGGISPYMSLSFMKQEIEFRPFYAFDNDNDNNNDNDHHGNEMMMKKLNRISWPMLGRYGLIPSYICSGN